MSWASSEVVGVLTFLLPGFLAAAIFHSLTSHPKPSITPSAFDRVIQALIFTVIGQAIVASILAIDGAIIENHQWSKNLEIVFSVSVAIMLGLIASYVSNRDTVHRILRRLGITKETSYPSEWYSAFSRHHDCYVLLHLKRQRRLYGWPAEWPSRPDEGHFRIAEAEWLVENEGVSIGYERIPATGVSAILIPAGDVKIVEFLSAHHEEPEEIRHGQGTDTTTNETRNTD